MVAGISPTFFGNVPARPGISPGGPGMSPGTGSRKECEACPAVATSLRVMIGDILYL